jgi:hypothetical protein
VCSVSSVQCISCAVYLACGVVTMPLDQPNEAITHGNATAPTRRKQ